MQGWNDFNQLGLDQQRATLVQFFPDFMKMDFLNEYKVIDLSFGSCSVNALVKDKT